MRATGLAGLVAAFLVTAVAAPLFAQSLADVAKKEEERRKRTPPARKVYTNKDLSAVPPATASPPASGSPDAAAPDASGGDTKTADAAPGDKPGAGTDAAGAKDQKYWSARMKAARDAVERDQILADAMQSRINALTTDFVNRDDPIQRSRVQSDRQKAMAELDRLKKQVMADKQAITNLEEEARRAGVPPGWLR
jgi:hypothetical protein